MQCSKMQYVRYLIYKRGSLINTDARTLKYKFTAGHIITTYKSRGKRGSQAIEKALQILWLERSQ